MKPSEINFGQTYHFKIGYKSMLNEIDVDQPYLFIVENSRSFIKYQLLRIELDSSKIKNVSQWKMVSSNFSNTIVVIKKWLKDEKELLIQTHTFPEVQKINEKLNIVFNDAQIDYLRKSLGEYNVKNWLDVEYKIPLNDLKNRCIVFTSFRNEEDENSFQIHGINHRIDIYKTSNGYQIKRITKRKTKPKVALTPLIVPLQFIDKSADADIRAEVSEHLDSLIHSKESYTQLWLQYQEIEKEDILKKALDLGCIRYKRKESNYEEKSFEVELIGKPEEIKNWLSKLSDYNINTLEVANYEPFFFQTRVWDDAKNIKDRSIFEVKKRDLTRNGTFLLSYQDRSNTFSELPPEGVLYQSLLGDVISMDRKDKAIEKIKTGNTSIPHLPLLLEGHNPNVEVTNHKSAMSTKLKRSLKGMELNEKQEEALRLAFTTPDVTLIQGPPGTGKTQIISALVNRIVEEGQKEGRDVSQKILLTSFQHDAVSNMAERTEINGLPTLKFSDTSGFLFTWKNKIKSKIEEQIKDIPEFPIQKVIREWIRESKIIRQNSNYDKNELIEKINLVEEKYNNDLKWGAKEKGLRLKQKLKEQQIQNHDEDNNRLIEYLHGLPDKKEQFLEDRSDACYNVIEELKKMDFTIEQEQNDLLNTLSDLFEEEPTDEQMAQLEKVKVNLLDRFNLNKLDKDMPTFPWKEWNEWLNEFVSDLSTHIKRNKSIAVKDVLERYKIDLSNYGYLEKTFKNYQNALASTIQQSASGRFFKQLTNDNHQFEFVIVDEAARANPLDLFIALTKGMKIILVGDQQQLPHLLEHRFETIILEEEEEEKIRNAKKFMLETSLFGRMYEMLKDLKVPRTVMLNTQYRMHPNIGNFVSSEFYEKFGFPKIKPGVLAKDRLHGIKELKDKQMVWMECSRGRESRADGSKKNEKEAQRIMTWVKETLPKHPNLSIGVITFYSAQVNQLYREATKLKLAKGREILPKYKKTAGGKERFRIGSVDAFQGKEFDVVILSMVRSNTDKIKENDIKSIRRKYGFLTKANRINVSMSRAKSLLIIAGDSRMLRGSDAKEYIPGLVSFYKTIKKENYGTII